MLIVCFVVSYTHMIEDTPTPTKDTNDEKNDFSTVQQWQEKDAAKRAALINFPPAIGYSDGSSESKESREFRDSYPERKKEKRARQLKGALAGLGIATLTGIGVGLLAHSEGGSDKGAERGTLDKTISSITLSPGAHLRFDPYVANPESEAPNDVLQLQDRISIDINSDARVLEGTSNGTWFAIPSSEVAAVIPDFDSKNDKDGILWVNEQGVESVQTTESETE